jgi:hypothetical protein
MNQYTAALKDILTIIVALLAPLAALNAADASQAARPNIIFIVADDLAYGEPSCYGGKDIVCVSSRHRTAPKLLYLPRRAQGAISHKARERTGDCEMPGMDQPKQGVRNKMRNNDLRLSYCHALAALRSAS